MTTCIRRPHAVWTTCPCPPCTEDRNRKTKLHRNGLYKRVPSSDAWETINRLLDRGWTSGAIASAAGLHWRTIEGAVSEYRNEGKLTQFGPAVSRKIVNHGDPTTGSVGSHGAIRRLRGLARQGWDLYTLGDRLGVNMTTLAAVRSGRTKRVRVALHQAIRDETERIGMTVGPSKPAALHARKQGWPGLLAWDDVDDPHERPRGIDRRPKTDVDESVVLRLLEGERLSCTTAERHEAMRRWKAAGGSEASFCATHGWKANRYAKGAA